MGGYSVYYTICLEPPQRKVRLHLNAADLGGFVSLDVSLQSNQQQKMKKK